MEPNPLLPSFPDLLLIVGIAMAVIVLLGVVLGVWLSNRARARGGSAGDDAQDGNNDAGP
ncbi:hypothetical protein ACIP5T_10035 [Microbacterium sp. NPDC088619]|uniref:hypothetical protein n=1 Tax=Microbacterium sp. NPDC088619 TaxID=3364196 RepID=UPI003803E03D